MPRARWELGQHTSSSAPCGRMSSAWKEGCTESSANSVREDWHPRRKPYHQRRGHRMESATSRAAGSEPASGVSRTGSYRRRTSRRAASSEISRAHERHEAAHLRGWPVAHHDVDEITEVWRRVPREGSTTRGRGQRQAEKKGKAAAAPTRDDECGGPSPASDALTALTQRPNAPNGGGFDRRGRHPCQTIGAGKISVWRPGRRALRGIIRRYAQEHDGLLASDSAARGRHARYAPSSGHGLVESGRYSIRRAHARSARSGGHRRDIEPIRKTKIASQGRGTWGAPFRYDRPSLTIFPTRRRAGSRAQEDRSAASRMPVATCSREASSGGDAWQMWREEIADVRPSEWEPCELERPMPNHGAGEPRKARDGADAHRDHDVRQARPQRRDDGDGEQDARERQEHVHRPHHDALDAREVAGEEPGQDPRGGPDARGDDPDEQRQARAVENARENAAAELVGAQREVGGRSGERARQVLRSGSCGENTRAPRRGLGGSRSPDPSTASRCPRKRRHASRIARHSYRMRGVEHP